MMVESILAQLERAQLVHPVKQEEQMFIFKNALTQESTYNSLLLKRRRELHRSVAETYEELYPDQLDAYAGILAHHYAQASDDAKTIDYALRAGDDARRVYAHIEAHAYYQHALEAMTRFDDSDELRRQQADTLVKLVSVAFSFQTSETSFQYLHQAESIMQELAARDNLRQDRLRLARIHYWLGRMHVYRNQTAEAIDALMRVLDEAADSGDDALLAFPSAVIGRIMNMQGQFGAANVLLRQAIESIERSGNLPEWIMTEGQLGMSLAARGEYIDGLAHGRRALLRALSIKNDTSIAEAQMILAVIYYIGGNYPKMRDAADACIKIAEPANSRFYLFTAYASRALAESILGHYADALASTARAQEIGETMTEGHAYTDWVASAHAEILLNAGQIEPAIESSKQATEIAQALGGIFALGLAERVWARALARTKADWAEIETHLTSSLNAFEAGEARLEAARTRVAWGKLGIERNRREIAREHWEIAAEQFKKSRLKSELERTHQWLEKI